VDIAKESSVELENMPNDITLKFNGALFNELEAGKFEMAERIWKLIESKNIKVC